MGGGRRWRGSDRCFWWALAQRETLGHRMLPLPVILYFFACCVALNTKDRGILVSLWRSCSGHGRFHILLEHERPCSHALLPPCLWFSPKSSKGTGLPCCAGFGSPVNPEPLPRALPSPSASPSSLPHPGIRSHSLHHSFPLCVFRLGLSPFL